MTLSEKSDWRNIFDVLDIDVQEADAPDEDGAANQAEQRDRAWFQTVTRFTRRGFLRVLVAPGEDEFAFHAQFAVPGADDAYAQTLENHLNSLSDIQWMLDTRKSPWLLIARRVPEQKAKAIVEVFKRVADHIAAAEDGARARVLAREFDARSADETPAADTRPNASNADTAEAANPFETIGDQKNSEQTEHAGPSDETMLDSFRVSVRDAVVHAELDLTTAVDDSLEKRLLGAIERTLTARFDITLLSRQLSSKKSAPATIKLAARGNLDPDAGELAHDLGRYFERLKKFNDLGMPLLEVLAPSSRTPSARTSPESNARPSSKTARRAVSRSNDGRQGRDKSSAESSNEVVFSFGGGALDVADITSDALKPGDYSDPRIRREDATTPLVDVVLRHPGYSDKSMRQVLSILLDVDYYEAAKLADHAPCLIAWGISHERAREFKRVIENAGGKVTLVEPDSLG
jgi:hypothetical protein